MKNTLKNNHYYTFKHICIIKKNKNKNKTNEDTKIIKIEILLMKHNINKKVY